MKYIIIKSFVMLLTRLCYCLFISDIFVLQKFVEKTIKISQRANNERGFGFTLVGGMERRQPVTVQRIALGKYHMFYGCFYFTVRYWISVLSWVRYVYNP